MAKSNAGIDSIANMLGNPLGFSGTATATSATSLTSSGFAASPAYVGQMVVAGTVYGVITAHSTTVLTVERWVNPATPGGAAGSTPSGTTTFSIVPGQAPAAFMALTANNSVKMKRPVVYRTTSFRTNTVAIIRGVSCPLAT